jgi:hypothetical protein
MNEIPEEFFRLTIRNDFLINLISYCQERDIKAEDIQYIFISDYARPAIKLKSGANKYMSDYFKPKPQKWWQLLTWLRS